MHSRLFLTVVALAALFTGAARGENPFLSAPDDKPRSAAFRGTEWGDEIGADDLPLRARVVTTRVAKMPWGAVFRVEYKDIASQAEKKRELPDDYFLVTDDRIAVINSEDIFAEVEQIAALPQPRPIEAHTVVGISRGKFAYPKDGPADAEIEVKGDTCTYLRSHNSGHWTRYTWKKGVGLVARGANYGARSDGWQLKRETPAARKKR